MKNSCARLWLRAKNAKLPYGHCSASSEGAKRRQVLRGNLRQPGKPTGKIRAARRFFNGQITPGEFFRTYTKFSDAYDYRNSLLKIIWLILTGLTPKFRPEALIFGYSQTLMGWSVMDRLHEIKVPTLVLAGRYDFLFPTEHQVALAAVIPNARLEVIENAGHNPHMEQPVAVQRLIKDFLADIDPR
ncbi:MAG: alpha/beta hydrolase [Anaerolineales bacterium]|nr:alpha/beta hydrolase [Anaerolineales bacterium]